MLRTIQRVHHANDTDVPLPARNETIETVEYSDGFGRMLQTRTQAEDVIFDDPNLEEPIFGDVCLPADQNTSPGDAVGHKRSPDDPLNVVVSGWQVYDNKGRVVEKYEPFFSTGWEYAPPREEERGQKVAMYYDPRGRVIRTVNPDNSEQRVIYGIPTDLNNPDVYTPTPWEVYTYDTNDNAGRTHHDNALSYQNHWNTPSSAVVDALGRTVETIARNGPNPENNWHVTRYTYDIQGNLLTVTDALDRVAFRYIFDLANNPLHIENIDAGIRRTVLDAAGNKIEQRDSKGTIILHAYDILNRPIRFWAQDKAGEILTLRERHIYGDSTDSDLTLEEAATKNLLGKIYTHYDEAGLLTSESYDFKGNILEKSRQVIKDESILRVFEGAEENNWEILSFRVDWHPPEGVSMENYADSVLDSNPYITSFTYDALNRIKTMRYPEDVTGDRKIVSLYYNRAGTLERVELDGEVYVEHIAYNAKGQRILIAYGNDIMTRYAYDPETLRLVRMHTEGYTNPDTWIYHPAGNLLQDFAYEYDLAGNILAIHDRTSDCGTPSQPDRLDRYFSYDPLYRLLEATGRECDTLSPQHLWSGAPRCEDIDRTRAYREHYDYDPVGSMTRLSHNGGSNGFSRNFTTVPNGNRLEGMTIGETIYSYDYDPNGNLILETTSRHFEWDHSDRMRVYCTQIEGSEPSVYAHYLYDSQGNRVKKLVRKQGGLVEVTVYIDGFFEHHCIIHGDEWEENNTLHVMDDKKRIATVRVGPPLNGDTTPPVKYHLGDHLDSSNVVIDGSGNWVNREEYTPYGETSFGGFVKKRYRFSGKEKDEESGLYYSGARYYAPWLARWASCDPAGMADGTNLYRFARNNPIHFADPTGRQPNDVTNIVFTEADIAAHPESHIVTATVPNFQDIEKTITNIDPSAPITETEIIFGESMPKEHISATQGLSTIATSETASPQLRLLAISGAQEILKEVYPCKSPIVTWSGGPPAKKEAAKLAQHIKGNTLEQTPAGQKLEKNPGTTYKDWKNASRSFASRAGLKNRPEVHVGGVGRIYKIEKTWYKIGKIVGKCTKFIGATVGNALLILQAWEWGKSTDEHGFIEVGGVRYATDPSKLPIGAIVCDISGRCGIIRSGGEIQIMNPDIRPLPPPD